eukprot:CFRG1446T1
MNSSTPVSSIPVDTSSHTTSHGVDGSAGCMTAGMADSVSASATLTLEASHRRAYEQFEDEYLVKKVYSALPAQSRLNRSFHLPLTTFDVWDESLAGPIPPQYTSRDAVQIVTFDYTPRDAVIEDEFVLPEDTAHTHVYELEAEKSPDAYPDVNTNVHSLVRDESVVVGENVDVVNVVDTQKHEHWPASMDRVHMGETITLEYFEQTLNDLLSQDEIDSQSVSDIIATSLSPALEMSDEDRSQLAVKLVKLFRNKEGAAIPDHLFPAIAHAAVLGNMDGFVPKKFFLQMVKSGTLVTNEILSTMLDVYLQHLRFAEATELIRQAKWFDVHATMDDYLFALSVTREHGTYEGAKASGVAMYEQARQMNNRVYQSTPTSDPPVATPFSTPTSSEFTPSEGVDEMSQLFLDDAPVSDMNVERAPPANVDDFKLPPSAYADVLSLCADTGDHHRSENVVAQMENDGVNMSYEVLEELLRLHVGLTAPLAGFDIIERGRSMGLRPSVDMFNAMLSVYTALNDTKKVEYILNGMQTDGVELNVVSHNLLLGMSCRNGDVQQAWEIIRQQNMNGQASHIGFLELVMYYFQAEQHQIVMEVLEEMVRMNTPYDTLFPSYLVALYQDHRPASGTVDQNVFEQQLRIWQFLTKNDYEIDNVASQLFILPSIVARDVSKTMNYITKLEANNVPIDEHMISLLVDGCVSESRSDLTRRVIEIADRVGQPISEQNYNTMLHMCIRAKELNDVAFVLNTMQERHLKVHQAKELSLLNLYLRSSGPKYTNASMSLIERLQDNRVIIEKSQYEQLAVRLGMDGRTENAVDVINTMKSHGFDPSDTYTAVVQALLSKNNVDGAVLMLRSCMRDKGNKTRTILDIVLERLRTDNETAIMQSLLAEVWAISDVRTPATLRALPSVLAHASREGTYDEMLAITKRMDESLLSRASTEDPLCRMFLRLSNSSTNPDGGTVRRIADEKAFKYLQETWRKYSNLHLTSLSKSIEQAEGELVSVLKTSANDAARECVLRLWTENVNVDSTILNVVSHINESKKDLLMPTINMCEDLSSKNHFLLEPSIYMHLLKASVQHGACDGTQVLVNRFANMGFTTVRHKDKVTPLLGQVALSNIQAENFDTAEQLLNELIPNTSISGDWLLSTQLSIHKRRREKGIKPNLEAVLQTIENRRDTLKPHVLMRVIEMAVSESLFDEASHVWNLLRSAKSYSSDNFAAAQNFLSGAFPNLYDDILLGRVGEDMINFLVAIGAYTPELGRVHKMRRYVFKQDLGALSEMLADETTAEKLECFRQIVFTGPMPNPANVLTAMARLKVHPEPKVFHHFILHYARNKNVPTTMELFRFAEESKIFLYKPTYTRVLDTWLTMVRESKDGYFVETVIKSAFSLLCTHGVLIPYTRILTMCVHAKNAEMGVRVVGQLHKTGVTMSELGEKLYLRLLIETGQYSGAWDHYKQYAQKTLPHKEAVEVRCVLIRHFLVSNDTIRASEVFTSLEANGVEFETVAQQLMSNTIALAVDRSLFRSSQHSPFVIPNAPSPVRPI